MANFQIKDLGSDSNPLGTDLFLKSASNGALAKITFSALKDATNREQNNALAIVANGNTHPAITSGHFVYVRDHSSLAEGLYKATTSIGTNAALSTSNLAAETSGGLNNLQDQVTSLNSNMTIKNYGSSSSTTSVKDHIIGMMDDVIADTTFPTSAYCPIKKALQGQDEYSGIAMKFDSSHGQLIVWDSSNHMYRCTRVGDSRYVGEFTGTNM